MSNGNGNANGEKTVFIQHAEKVLVAVVTAILIWVAHTTNETAKAVLVNSERITTITAGVGGLTKLSDQTLSFELRLRRLEDYHEDQKAEKRAAAAAAAPTKASTPPPR